PISVTFSTPTPVIDSYVVTRYPGTTNQEPRMLKLLIAICVTLSLAASAPAQTASELGHKYAHHEVYEVQPGVQMAAKFAPDGLVCEMRLEQAHFGKDRVDMRHGIDEERINGLIDELVPLLDRREEDKADR